MKKITQNFNAQTVPLIQTNLIEASAGTGKTYSIAILVLRLIVEESISIQKILMVTFTKAAVAELEERIRKFIRLAQKVSKGESIADETIKNILSQATQKQGETQVAQLLEHAVLFLDETSVLTIHSFCQQTLNQFAFETNQLFGVELMSDLSSIILSETNQFWRKHITNIPIDLLDLLMKNGLSREAIMSIVGNHLGGMKYLAYAKNPQTEITAQDFDDFTQQLSKIEKEIDLKKDSLFQYLKDNYQTLYDACERNRYASASISPVLNDLETAIHVINEKKATVYVKKIFSEEFLIGLDELEELLNEQKTIASQILTKFYCFALSEIIAGVTYYKSRYNQITYDDLINNLHQALCLRDNPKLVACLQEKYQAVFIDEFQDTDKKQYEIFNQAFADNTILFYIGDPKQSIYAWRKADIFTYFDAKSDVENRYSMNQNYRSSADYINAMNHFFKPTLDFNTFYFEGKEQQIDYINVESPATGNTGYLSINDEKAAPIGIYQSSNKGDIYQQVVVQIVKLLSENASIINTKGESRKIVPQDIGVLVRSKAAGQDIKRMLAIHNIPAITINDGKVLQTEEAKFVLYLLEAIFEISTAAIHKALLSPFTLFTQEEILKLNDELIIGLFRNYKNSWETMGIYSALNQFIKDFDVQNNLLNIKTNGERIITNLLQLSELLHKTQNAKNLTALELISWLKRGIEGMEISGDEYEQRIENDEEAIKIVTIHASKGLEYNIVFAPTLDLKDEPFHSLWSFRDPTDKDYFFAESSILSDEQKALVKEQNEQENRRLVYVAITRAVYKCYIFKNTWRSNSNTSISKFIDKLKADANPLVEFAENEDLLNPNYKYNTQLIDKKIGDSAPVNFNLNQQNWRKLSYSFLRASHDVSAKPRSQNYEDEYGSFIFSQLKKGAKTGNMLHYIFENIHFNDSAKWGNVIDQTLNQFLPQQKEEYQPFLNQMLTEVLNADIAIGDDSFKLADVNPYQCIHEFEFDFDVNPFYPQSLASLSTDEVQIDVKNFPEMEGLMNGKIDLFFEHKGKYYVLDWKSNYLGDQLTDYSPEQLNIAMNENNYHLQYLIYSLAVKKYLESRIENFNYKFQFGGVIYLYIRGMRANKNFGVFATKPTWKTLASLNHKLEGVFWEI
jgi:exodeoxyribonuclease V beta subunit